MAGSASGRRVESAQSVEDDARRRVENLERSLPHLNSTDRYEAQQQINDIREELRRLSEGPSRPAV